MSIRQTMDDLLAMRKLPRVTVDLMVRETAGNYPFFERVTRQFYRSSRKRHRKLPLIGVLTHGVALCELPETAEEYFMLIEAAGRRNVKKSN